MAKKQRKKKKVAVVKPTCIVGPQPVARKEAEPSGGKANVSPGGKEGLLEDPANLKLDFLEGSKFNATVTQIRTKKRIDWTDLKAEEVFSRVEKGAELNKLKEGFDLGQVSEPWCCFGGKSWKGRDYAHNFSSGFSSPELLPADNFDGEQVDFVSALTNLKELFKAGETKNQLSYLVHRVGDTVTIDHLDLGNALMFPNYLELPPTFLQFLETIFSSSRDEILKEGRSRHEVIYKEAYHKLLHSSMKTPMELSSTGGFLQRVVFSVGNYKILAGSNTPVYSEIGSNSSQENVTVRLFDCSTAGGAEYFDIWLESTLHNCSKSFVHLQDAKNPWKISKITVFPTKSLSNAPMEAFMTVGHNILDFLHSNVDQGHSYWLYRPPGGRREFKLINLSKLKDSETKSPIFSHWPKLEPYIKYFEQAELIKYGESLGDILVEQLATETKFHPPSPKTEELSKRFEETAKSVISFGREAKYLQKLITSTEEVSVLTMPSILACLKAVYARVALLTRNGSIAAIEHSVKKYFNVVLTLAEYAGPLNSRFKNWDIASRTRIYAKSYLESLSDFVSWLLETHAMYPWPPDEIPDQLWSYFYIRLSLLQGDILSDLAANVYEKLPLRISPDFSLPNDSTRTRITSIYRSILEYIENIDFPLHVSPPFVPLPREISQTEVNDIVSKELGLSYLSHALFLLSAPSYLQNAEEPFSSTPEGIREKVKKFYENVVEKLKSSFGTLTRVSSLEPNLVQVKDQVCILTGILSAQSFQLANWQLLDQIMFFFEPVRKLQSVALTLSLGQDYFDTALYIYSHNSEIEVNCAVARIVQDEHILNRALQSFKVVSVKDMEQEKVDAIQEAIKALNKCAQAVKHPTDFTKLDSEML